MAVQSYIGLVNYIENFAQNHLQIRRFKAEFDEQLPNFATETEAYPILFMSPVSNVYSQNDDRFIVKFYCFDVIQKDRSNINNIYSDTSLILNDLKKFIQDGDNYLFNVDSVESNAIPINNALLDYVAGVQMELIIQVDTYSYCEIPLDDGILVPTTGIDVVYSQYLTCETVTACTTLQEYITSEVQSQASTTFSGGTVVNDTEFLSNVTIEGDTYVSLISGDTANFTNYFSGGTSLDTIIRNLEDITRVQDGVNTYTGGTPNFPTVNVVDSPSFNNISFSGTATGGDMIVNGLSATTIFSGGTNLNTIITTIAQDQGDKTRVQPGTNINTGGTENFPVVNLNDNISVTSISAATIYSGSTNLGTILENYTTDNEFAGHTGNTSNPHQVTAAQVGAYTTGQVDNLLLGYTTDAEFAGHTGNTSNPHNTTAAQVGAYAIAETNNLLNTKANLSGATFTGTIDAPVILSGGTDLYTIFSTIDTNDITRVQPGTNTSTGGTANAPTVNVVDSPSFNNIAFSGTATGGNVSANSLSASTLYSGSTNLESIFALVGSGDVTRVQPGSNIATGGTGNLPIVSLVANPSINNLTFSGTATGGSIIGSSISATTFYSGGTNLQTIITTIASGVATGDVTRVQSGLNTYTGGTGTLPTINISAATLNNLSVSGTSVLAATTATTIAVLNSSSATTTFADYNGNAIESGTSLSNIIGGRNNRISANKNNIQIIGGDGITGTTDGTTYTNNLDVRGALLSGGTNLYSIFSTGSGDVTRVQSGSNITTGGTGNLPTISLAASPSINGLSFSGTATGNALSATTLSGGTILSGSTNLYSIFLPQAGTIPYDFMAAASDETTVITTGTSKVTFLAPRTFTLTGITVSLVTTGSTTSTIDVNYNGSSVFATPISLASGVFYATTATTTSAISKYGKFTVDFDAVGTGSKGVKITLEGRTTI